MFKDNSYEGEPARVDNLEITVVDNGYILTYTEYPPTQPPPLMAVDTCEQEAPPTPTGLIQKAATAPRYLHTATESAPMERCFVFGSRTDLIGRIRELLA